MTYRPLDSRDDHAIRRLWAAVLLRAMRDSVGLAESGQSAQASRASRTIARRWFSSRQGFGFRLACEVTDIEPSQMRSRARQIYEGGATLRSPCQARVELRDYFDRGRHDPPQSL